MLVILLRCCSGAEIESRIIRVCNNWVLERFGHQSSVQPPSISPRRRTGRGRPSMSTATAAVSALTNLTEGVQGSHLQVLWLSCEDLRVVSWGWG